MFEAVKSHQRAGKDCSTLDIFHCAVRLCSIQVQSKTNKQKKMKKTKKCPTLEAKPKENLLILGHFNVGTIYFVSKHLLCLKNGSKSPSHYLTSYRKISEGESSCPQHDAHNEDRGPADVLGSCLKCATKNKCWSASGWFSDQWRAHLAGV